MSQTPARTEPAGSKAVEPTSTDPAAPSPAGPRRPRPKPARPRPKAVVVRGEGKFAIFLLLPAALVVFGVVLYPVIRTLLISLYKVDSAMPGSYPFAGLSNYTKVFSDPSFYPVLGHTAYFTLVSTAIELVLGLGVALLLNAPLRFRWLWRSLVVLPWALPTIVNGALWRWIYNGQYGVLNQLLGTDTQWLGSPFLALNMVIVADVWKNTSIVAFFLLAGLQTIPAELHEAAVVDGASKLRTFWSVVVPLLKPSIAVVLVLRTIEAFKVFDIIYVMTGGGPASGTQTVAFYTYLQAFSNQLFGYGAALAYLIVIAVGALAMFYLRILRQNQLAGV